MGTRLGEGRTCECREAGHGDFELCAPLSPPAKDPKTCIKGF